MEVQAGASTELPTMWTVPDELWEEIAPILAKHDPPHRLGRKRIDARRTLDAIIYRLRSGVQWNQLPDAFPDDSSVHRTFQRWQQRAIMDRIWALIQTACADLGGVDWEWQAADGAMSKARLGGTSSGPTRPIAASRG
jgi:transposase